jgi:hypothetical protein
MHSTRRDGVTCGPERWPSDGDLVAKGGHDGLALKIKNEGGHLKDITTECESISVCKRYFFAPWAIVGVGNIMSGT